MTIKPHDNPTNQNPEQKDNPGDDALQRIHSIVEGNFDFNRIFLEEDMVKQLAEHYEESFQYVFEGFPENPTAELAPYVSDLQKIKERKKNTPWGREGGGRFTIDPPEGNKKRKLYGALMVLHPDTRAAKEWGKTMVFGKYGTKKNSMIPVAGIRPVSVSKQWAGMALTGATAVLNAYPSDLVLGDSNETSNAEMYAHEVQLALLRVHAGNAYFDTADELAKSPPHDFHDTANKLLGTGTINNRYTDLLDEKANWSGEEPQSEAELKYRRAFHAMTLLRAQAIVLSQHNNMESFRSIQKAMAMAQNLYLYGYYQ